MDLLGLVGLGVLDTLRSKREEEGADALRLFGIRVGLFEGKIGWVKKFEEKMGRKTILECV